MIDVTTQGPDGNWEHADVTRLCEYRDELHAQVKLGPLFTHKVRFLLNY